MNAQTTTNSATRLYVGNLALLTTHQADAAFWHEWDVFGVPGGLPMFLGFNVVVVALVGQGLVRVAAGAPSARRAAMVCAALGLLTVLLHTVFLWRDRAAFWAPSSIGVLLGVLVVSVAQLRKLPASPMGHAP
jgi:hypothetical protein